MTNPDMWEMPIDELRARVDRVCALFERLRKVALLLLTAREATRSAEKESLEPEPPETDVETTSARIVVEPSAEERMAEILSAEAVDVLRLIAVYTNGESEKSLAKLRTITIELDFNYGDLM